MSDLIVHEKTCSDCGETKPLSDFHRNSSRPDGRHIYCKPCALARVKASQQKKRAEIGEAAWKQSRVEAVRRHRARGRDQVSRLGKRAYDRALFELRDRHPDEFQALLRRHRYELGLDVKDA